MKRDEDDPRTIVKTITLSAVTGMGWIHRTLLEKIHQEGKPGWIVGKHHQAGDGNYSATHRICSVTEWVEENGTIELSGTAEYEAETYRMRGYVSAGSGWITLHDDSLLDNS